MVQSGLILSELSLSNLLDLPDGIKDTRLVAKDGLKFLQPDWPAANRVQGLCSTRTGGTSVDAYASFNLASHVDDNAQTVIQNRNLLNNVLALPGEPYWLEQVHSDKAVVLPNPASTIQADASYTSQFDTVCVVQTADCLPVLVSDIDGQWVAAIHAGWRGLASQIISKTIAHYAQDKARLLFWLGPAISARHYEIDAHVYQTFIAQRTDYQRAFTDSREGHYFLDVYQAARIELGLAGIHHSQIFGGGACSYADADLFYSYRRDGAKTGRMASLIWIDEN